MCARNKGTVVHWFTLGVLSKITLTLHNILHMHQLQLNPSISTGIHISFDEAMKSAFTDKNQTARLSSTPPELNIYIYKPKK